MFHTYRKDLIVDLIKDTNHKISPEKITELNALTEAIESAHKLDTSKPSYEAYHINRFLGCKNAFGVTSNVNKKLDFGVIARRFSLEENIGEDQQINRGILLESFKYKFGIKGENTLYISDDKSHNMFFLDAVSDPNLNIKGIDDKRIFYISLINHSNNSALSEMIDHNIDNLHKLLTSIYNSTQTLDIKICLIVRGFHTTSFKKLISHFSQQFEKCGIYCTLIDLNWYSNFVYFFNKTNDKISDIPLTDIKMIDQISHNVNHIWKDLIQIKVKLSLETKILNSVFNQVNTFGTVYDIYQLIVLKDNIEYASKHQISYKPYHEHLLRENMDMIKFALTPIISLDCLKHSDNIIDYYQTISIMPKYQLKSYPIDAIQTLDDIMFFDVCNNNFIFENQQSYFADSSSAKLVKSYVGFYNIPIKSSNKSSDIVFIEDMTNLPTNLLSNCKVILKIDAFDKSQFNPINDLIKSFENKFIYAPLMGQLYTSHVYVILDKYNTAIRETYSIDITQVICTYLINYKIMVDYLAILFGTDYLEKIFMKGFLDGI